MLVACNVVAACFLCIACLQCVVAVEPELFGQKTIINDEYCDLFDGSDEPHTSACSHLKVQEFHCKSNGNKGITNVTIAASKVNDGVCDCCDGSDESSPHHAPCKNVCDAEWAEERKKALSMYRNIQAGMRARTEVTESFKLAHNREIQQIDKLKAEHEIIDKMLFRMMLLLKREEKHERTQRFMLIREREARCADGVVPACEYFKSGYFDDDELLYEGYPLEYANPQKRFHYVHTQAELDQQAKLTGLERVRLAICTVKDLLPDDDARIFTQVGEFMAFANSPGGKISRDTTSPHKRKLNTLFGRFLENGDKGFLQGQLLILEWLGLLVSPVTLSMRMVGYGAQLLVQSLWHSMQQCAATAVTHRAHDAYPTTLAQWCQLVLDSDVEGSQVANVVTVLDYTRYSFIMTTLDIWSEYLSTPMWIWEVMYRAPLMYFDYYIRQNGNQLPPRRQCCLLRSGIHSARAELQTLEQRIAAQEELVHQSALRRYVKTTTSDNSNETGRKKRSKKRANKDEVLVPLDFGPGGTWESVVNSCLEREEGGHSYSFCYFGEIKQDGVVSLGRFTHWGSTPAKAAVPTGSVPIQLQSLEVDASGSATVPSEPERTPFAPTTPDTVTDNALSEQISADAFSWLQEALQSVLEQAAALTTYLAQENKIIGASPALNKLLASGSNFFQSLSTTGSTSARSGATVTDVLTGSAKAATRLDTSLYAEDPVRQQAYYSAQRYGGGTPCYPRQGMARYTDVLFECGMNSAITEIVETEVCVYKFVISTPLVCTKHLESTALRKLDELGVFGFSSGNNNKDVKQGANKGAKSGSSGARKAGKMSTQGRN